MALDTFDFREPSNEPDERWNGFSQWQTEATPLFAQAPTPGIPSSRASPISLANQTPCPQISQSQPHTLPLLQWEEWDEKHLYNEDPPTCIHYSIEWKVTLPGRIVSQDTEPDLVLAPSKHWELFLRPKLGKLLDRKYPDKHLDIDDTSIVVSVNDRTHRNLVKRFDELNIDWPLVEAQLIKWAELCRVGKRLRINIIFNYKDSSHGSANYGGTTKRRGRTSATARMQAELDAQLNAEQDTLGQTSAWRDVYNLMRCPDPPCNLGPHCWRDPDEKKHYRLRTSHLKSLIRHVEQGGILRSHGDVPRTIREDLYTEEQQRLQTQSKNSHYRSASYPPISIVLPTQSSLPSYLNGGCEKSSTALPTRSYSTDRLNVPGFLDVAVTKYTDWLQSRMRDHSWKGEIRKACVIALADGLDLEQIYEDQDPDFFVRHGVRRGIARRFVRDIKLWVEQYQSDEMEEP